jgi:hypothetical protein
MTRLKWKLILVLLDILLILKLDRCTVCIECIMGLESFWRHPMELLGDVGHVESHMFLFGDTVSVSTRLVHGLRQTYHWLRNHFGHT